MTSKPHRDFAKEYNSAKTDTEKDLVDQEWEHFKAEVKRKEANAAKMQASRGSLLFV